MLGNLVRYITNKASQIFFCETLLSIQYDLSQTLLKLETEVIDNNPSGIFINRLSKDTYDVANIFSEINDSIIEILTNVGILLAIYVVNKYMFLFFVIALTVVFWFKKQRMKYYFKRDEEYRKLSEKNTSLITELIRGLKDIKVLNAEKNFLDEMYTKLKESNQKRYEMFKTNCNYGLITATVHDLFDLAFIILGIYLSKNSTLTVSSFVVLYMYRDKIYWFLDSVTYFIEQFKRFNVSAKRVFELTDNNLYQKEKFGNIHLSRISGNFKFENVNFGYKDKLPILKNVSFEINPDETVAFVGKSGAGKSTIFSLLTKLYHAQSGKISIDGVNINNLDKESIRNNIAIITQAPYIFNFSIKDNLKMINNKATDKEIIEACKSACLHDFIMSLPNKYDTLVGEGGVMLSGGERQRLAIARAFLKKSEIILFDEATSSLDNETQKQIQQAINNMKGKQTVLIIAHRLSTVINSDRIIVIDDGKVVAEGTHKYLYKNNEVYRNLYEKELTK